MEWLILRQQFWLRGYFDSEKVIIPLLSQVNWMKLPNCLFKILPQNLQGTSLNNHVGRIKQHDMIHMSNHYYYLCYYTTK